MKDYTFRSPFSLSTPLRNFPIVGRDLIASWIVDFGVDPEVGLLCGLLGGEVVVFVFSFGCLVGLRG